MRLKLVLKVLVAVVAIALAAYVCLVAFGVYTALDSGILRPLTGYVRSGGTRSRLAMG